LFHRSAQRAAARHPLAEQINGSGAESIGASASSGTDEVCQEGTTENRRDVAEERVSAGRPRGKPPGDG